jgi:hypothetical protein
MSIALLVKQLTVRYGTCKAKTQLGLTCGVCKRGPDFVPDSLID